MRGEGRVSRQLETTFAQNSRGRRRLGLGECDPGFIVPRQIQQSLLRKRVGPRGELAAAFRLLFEGLGIHRSPIIMDCWGQLGGP